MKQALAFEDFAFKLAVINKLMYEDEVLTPPLEAQSFLEEARGLAPGEGYGVLEQEGHTIIPEVKTYFENLVITAEMVQDITELHADGGDDIYLQLIPFWDGEDDCFEVQSAVDVKLLPNLAKATLLFAYPGDELIAAFRAQGVALQSV